MHEEHALGFRDIVAKRAAVPPQPGGGYLLPGSDEAKQLAVRALKWADAVSWCLVLAARAREHPLCMQQRSCCFVVGARGGGICRGYRPSPPWRHEGAAANGLHVRVRPGGVGRWRVQVRRRQVAEPVK